MGDITRSLKLEGAFQDASGTAIAGSGTNVNLYSVNTITPALAETDTSDANGLFELEKTDLFGRFDVKLTNGNDQFWIRARDRYQVTAMEARNNTATTEAAAEFYNTATGASGRVAIFGYHPATESTGVETSDTPSDNDEGYISFAMTNDNATPQLHEYARLTWIATDVSDGSEDGTLSFDTVIAGTLTEQMRLATDGLFLLNGFGAVIGHTAQVVGNTTSELQVLGTGAGDSDMTLGRWSADSGEPKLHFIKSRDPVIADGTFAIVQDNDIVGGLYFTPDDGTDFTNLAARFFAQVDDASPAANDIGIAYVWEQMPGGGGVRAETMRLGANGALTLSVSADSAAVADQVSIGRFEIGGGNTVIALSQETAVVTEIDETKFSHKVQMRINGVNYFVMLADS